MNMNSQIRKCSPKIAKELICFQTFELFVMIFARFRCRTVRRASSSESSLLMQSRQSRQVIAIGRTSNNQLVIKKGQNIFWNLDETHLQNLHFIQPNST